MDVLTEEGLDATLKMRAETIEIGAVGCAQRLQRELLEPEDPAPSGHRQGGQASDSMATAAKPTPSSAKPNTATGILPSISPTSKWSNEFFKEKATRRHSPNRESMNVTMPLSAQKGSIGVRCGGVSFLAERHGAIDIRSTHNRFSMAATVYN